MITRVATVEDAEGISRVHVASWKSAYRGVLPNAYLDGLAVTARRIENWRAVLAEDDGTHAATLVADDGFVLGFAHVGPSRDDDAGTDVGELWAIYAAPERYGTGIGRALMIDALELLAASFSEATLWVLERNLRARRFYEDGGWTPDGSVQPIEIGGASVTEMRYRLALTVGG